MSCQPHRVKSGRGGRRRVAVGRNAVIQTGRLKGSTIHSHIQSTSASDTTTRRYPFYSNTSRIPGACLRCNVSHPELQSPFSSSLTPSYRSCHAAPPGRRSVDNVTHFIMVGLYLRAAVVCEQTHSSGLQSCSDREEREITPTFQVSCTHETFLTN